MLDAIKMQFNASINSVSNAFRTPIFGIAKEDSVEWTPTNDKLENGEFAFTYDQVVEIFCLHLVYHQMKFLVLDIFRKEPIVKHFQKVITSFKMKLLAILDYAP
jgi:hypothetical protein